MPVLATQPPNIPAINPETFTGTFVPTQATWAAGIVIGTLPLLTTEPQSAKRQIAAPPPPVDDEPPARPRKAAAIPAKRDRKIATPKAAAEIPFEQGPVWREKVFGPPRS